MKSEKIIIYHNYIDGITLYKVNDLDNRAYIKVTKDILIDLLKNDTNMIDMIINDYGNFNRQQLESILKKVKHLFNHNEKYHDLRKIKGIEFV
jgi:uncharacterized membrane protein